MTVFDTDDPRNIWVRAGDGGGLGTHESPFPEIAPALNKAAPGQRVILMPGIYGGDLTIEISGEEKAPVYITAQIPGESIVDGGCWYFYDTSDLAVSGLTFKNAKRGAISVMGQCLRNRFHNMDFIGCGTDGKASCTFYFGGAGGRFNIVEECGFERPTNAKKGNISAEDAVVGLMISDGGDDAPLTSHIIRNNRFSGYDRAVIVGSGSSLRFESGHTVDLNRIDDCAFEGIVVKCGDVRVRGNEISKCTGFGIVLDGGEESEAEGNVISGCGNGISLGGISHTITGNHITK
jgi:parallel beta-helix repeat protein